MKDTKQRLDDISTVFLGSVLRSKPPQPEPEPNCEGAPYVS